jgi:hypothetical protein
MNSVMPAKAGIYRSMEIYRRNEGLSVPRQQDCRTDWLIMWDVKRGSTSGANSARLGFRPIGARHDLGQIQPITTSHE